jgi:glycyl-tRNA synthetase beta chain
MSEFETADLLVELGCEELPPKSLTALAAAFFEGVCDGLEAADITFDRASSRSLYTPRRLALLLSGVAERQPDRVRERRGPALSAAFDADGEPTSAAIGFASSVGLEVHELETVKTDKGEWLFCKLEEPGKSLHELLFPVLRESLERLPVPRPMRWSGHDFSFIRPVHWLVVLHGEHVVDGSLYGRSAGRSTRGHRVHSPGPHDVSAASDYQRLLESAFVLVDQDRRKETIRARAASAGTAMDGVTKISQVLLDEVNNMVEWPVAVGCRFDSSFLDVPHEALIASMEDHQKFFPVLDSGEGDLLPFFVAISNLESKDPKAVREGFERVIRPRLADARFFWEQDRQRPLEHNAPALHDIVFQEELGSIGDKSARIGGISTKLAEIIGVDPEPAARAASLSKCDLVSQMVGEFPELQGIMGSYYALESGEDPEVCTAIGEHYAPRYSGDGLPESVHGQILSLADRLDTLVGIFAIGLQPTGNRDPFALRRAALGVVRILIDKDIGVPLERLLSIAAEAFSGHMQVSKETLSEVRDFILDRARSHFRDRGYRTRLVNAVFAAPLDTLPDLFSRLQSLDLFMQLPAADSLVTANKRIGNILRKSEETISQEIDENMLEFEEERALFEEVMRLESALGPLFEAADYAPALQQLAGLQEAVDRFFDEVLVMADDPAVRGNRLALLLRLKGLFDHVADLSMAA